MGPPATFPLLHPSSNLKEYLSTPQKPPHYNKDVDPCRSPSLRNRNSNCTLPSCRCRTTIVSLASYLRHQLAANHNLTLSDLRHRPTTSHRRGSNLYLSDATSPHSRASIITNQPAADSNDNIFIYVQGSSKDQMSLARYGKRSKKDGRFGSRLLIILTSSYRPNHSNTLSEA